MFREGHAGISLLIASGVWMWVDGGVIGIVATILILVTELLPDFDTKIEGIEHRGPTHSLLFAGAVSVPVGLIGMVMGHGWLFFVFPFGAILGHLIGDLPTPMGIKILWPLDSRSFSLDWCKADNTWLNYVPLFVGLVTFVTIAIL